MCARIRQPRRTERLRTSAGALFVATLLAAPTTASAQLIVTPPCVPGSVACSPLGFEFASALRPIELAEASFGLRGGWSFDAAPPLAVDLFGPIPLFAPGASAFGAGFRTLELNFLAALFGPAAPAPGCGLDPIPCVGFAVNGGFGPPTFVSAGLLTPPDPSDLAFDWRAVDIDGTVYQGRVRGPTASVPEPASWLLIAAAAGLLWVRLRWEHRST